MKFEALLTDSYYHLKEATMNSSQRKMVASLRSDGWEITNVGDDLVSMSNDGEYIGVTREGKVKRLTT